MRVRAQAVTRMVLAWASWYNNASQAFRAISRGRVTLPVYGIEIETL